MAIQHINYGLTASFADGSNVAQADFLGQLQNLDAELISASVFDRGQEMSALIVFIEKSVKDFSYTKDAHLELNNTLEMSFNSCGKWLATQKTETFQKFAANGLCVSLFFELWIDQDQLELALPPPLLLQCGRLNLPIRISSNE